MRELKLTPASFAMLSVVLLFVSIDFRCIEALRGQPLGLDWLPLWAAAQISPDDRHWLYDFVHITNAQEPWIGTAFGSRPFVYPPSALPIFAPFAFLPALPSYAVWTATTGAIYLAASSRLSGQWWLLPLFPAVLLAALVGQTSILIGGMLIAALHMLDKRPAWAGILFGIATAIKPQTLILVPVALMVARNWRALAFWGAGGGAMLLLSLAWIGLDAWSEWLRAVARFQASFRNSPTLLDDAIAPYALAQRLGLSGSWVLVAAAGLALAAILATFRSPRHPSDRLIALAGGALLIAPYAMNYELALLAPALLPRRDDKVRSAVMLLSVAASILFGLGVCGLVLAVLSLWLKPWPRSSTELSGGVATLSTSNGQAATAQAWASSTRSSPGSPASSSR